MQMACRVFRAAISPVFAPQGRSQRPAAPQTIGRERPAQARRRANGLPSVRYASRSRFAGNLPSPYPQQGDCSRRVTGGRWRTADRREGPCRDRTEAFGLRPYPSPTQPQSSAIFPPPPGTREIASELPPSLVLPFLHRKRENPLFYSVFVRCTTGCSIGGDKGTYCGHSRSPVISPHGGAEAGHEKRD